MYLAIKHLHITCVALSLAGFLLRGLWMCADSPLLYASLTRRLPHIVDALLLGEVYAAGEAPIVAADGRSLARALRVAGKIEPVFVESIEDMPRAILSAAQDGDVVITMGARSIGGVPGKLVSGEVQGGN